MFAMEEILSHQELSVGSVITLSLLILWSLIWKGIALWKSARLSHKKWFIVLLVINTVGILEICYIYFIASKYSVETIDDEELSSDSEVESEK